MMAVKFFGILFLVLYAVLSFPKLALADQLSITLSGNGEGSTSDATVAITSTSTINQTNTANIQNNIDLSANTGDNSATNNTDGDTTITTGDITQTLDVLNIANANGTSSGASYTQETNVSISDNGTGSTNNVLIDLSNISDISQTNSADVGNNVNLDVNTGGNEASGNTNGSVNTSTGDINQEVSITNCINLNWFGLFNPFECPRPQGGPGEPPPGGGVTPPSVTPPVTEILTQTSPSQTSSSPSGPSAGEVLGAAILPLTGAPFNLWAALLGSLAFMTLGYFLIMRSYSLELALVKENRGRYYNKDEL